LDGNGRIGRLLITFLFVHGGVIALRDEHVLAIRDLPASAARLLDHLYEQPLVTAGSAASSPWRFVADRQ